MDSDSEPEHEKSEEAKQIEAINRRLQAQSLEAQTTGEIDKLREAQKRESARKKRQVQRQASFGGGGGGGGGGHPDLNDLDFGSIPSNRNQALPPPMRPDEEAYVAGLVLPSIQPSQPGCRDHVLLMLCRALSDYSEDYDSSDDEWQRARSRRQSMAKSQPKAESSTRDREWAALDDDQSSINQSGLLDPNDPFGDPFADDNDTPIHERQRMQCESESGPESEFGSICCAN